MSVTDRWHRDPREGDQPCRCGTQARPLYPSADHRKGDRWQVRWRDEDKAQRARNFRLREGKDPDLHADAYDKQVQAGLSAGTYAQREKAEEPFRAYAEDWRAHRTHGQTTAAKLERSFRLHVYEGDRRGLTARGGPAIGHHPLADLASRPSLIQKWIAGLTVSGGTAAGVVDRVSSVFNAAVDDGIISRNPLLVKSVTKPVPPENEAVPFTHAQVSALVWGLRHASRCTPDCRDCPANRFDILPDLGMGTGMRQGELFGLAEADIGFGEREIRVCRQVKLIGGVQVFSDIKNDKIHTVPVTSALCGRLDAYMEMFPPVRVTLPLEEDGRLKGKTATHALVLTRPGGLAMHREGVNGRWKSALRRAGIEVRRQHMMHALRHTAASVWLSHGVGAKAVARFLGDTEHTVIKVYSHMMPGDEDKARRAMEDYAAGLAGSAPEPWPTGGVH